MELSSKYACKCQGFPGTQEPFLPHNLARLPKNFLVTGFRVNGEKKLCGAVLSGRTPCFSIGAT
jgi:hypothetical protein